MYITTTLTSASDELRMSRSRHCVRLVRARRLLKDNERRYLTAPDSAGRAFPRRKRDLSAGSIFLMRLSRSARDGPWTTHEQEHSQKYRSSRCRALYYCQTRA